MAEIKTCDANENLDFGVVLLQKLTDMIDELSEDEMGVFNEIAKTFDEVEYPVDLFSSKSLDELNEIFGGHDDKVITEKVRDALNMLRLLDEDIKDCNEAIPEAKKAMEKAE